MEAVSAKQSVNMWDQNGGRAHTSQYTRNCHPASYSMELLGGKPKWLPLNFGFNGVMRTVSILNGGLSALRHGIQNSVEANAACHPALSTE